VAGADVNTPKSETNSTPLLEAILKRDADLTQRLLAAGAAVNTTITDHRTQYRPFITSVLPAAVSWGYYPCIRDIIDAGADVNAPQCLSGKTALTVAVEKGDSLTTQLLIDSGADVNASAASAIGYPALATSVRNSDINMVRYLLAFGADVDEQALIAAVPKGQNLMQMLLTARFTRSQRYPNGFGYQALQHATVRSNAGMIELLLSNGVDPNTIVRRQYGKNEAQADALPPSVSGYGRSALGVAIRHDKSQDFWMINMLLRGGANLNRIVSEAGGLNALTAAVDQKNLRLVETLLKAGADVNLRIVGSMSRTPLQLAVEQGNLDIAIVLLEHGADVNAPPSERFGATALQFAAIKGYLGIASVLVEKGADPNATAAKVGGRTALEGAAEHGRIDMLQFLVNAGAQVIGLGSEQYERARKFASENGHIAARRLLERYHSQQLDHQTPWNSLDTDIGSIENIVFEGWGHMDLIMDDSVFGTLT
jgi:ankyrin repeat protein